MMHSLRSGLVGLLVFITPACVFGQGAGSGAQSDMAVLIAAAAYVRQLEPTELLRIDRESIDGAARLHELARHLGVSIGSFEDTFACPEPFRCEALDSVEVLFRLGQPEFRGNRARVSLVVRGLRAGYGEGHRIVYRREVILTLTREGSAWRIVGIE